MKPAGIEARYAREIGGDGVDVFQIGRNRIGVLLAQLPGGFGVVGPRIRSTCSKAATKSCLIRRRIFWALR